jgi:DNA-binding phage protein
MTSDTRTTWTKKRAHWARENSAYLHKLLTEKDPEYLAALRRAERRIDLELSWARGES